MGVADVMPVDPDYPVQRELDDDVVIEKIQGNLERRKQTSAIQLRTWDLNKDTMTLAEQKLLDAFFIARGGRYDSFSFLSPFNHDRLIEGLSVGTGDGSTTVLDLDNADYFRRVFTGTGTRNQAYVDGSPVAATFANTDGSKTSAVTYTVAPGAATVLTVNIDIYRICRFDSRLKDALIAYQYFSTNYSFKELARDSI